MAYSTTKFIKKQPFRQIPPSVLGIAIPRSAYNNRLSFCCFGRFVLLNNIAGQVGFEPTMESLTHQINSLDHSASMATDQKYSK